jgi:hypothetical protein
MRRVLAVCVGIVLIATGAVWSWKTTRAPHLTAEELNHTVHPPSAPHPADCSSELSQVRSLSTNSQQERPKKNVAPLSEDEIAIYRTVLTRWTGRKGSLNVSAKTFPLNQTSSLIGSSDCACLQGIFLEGSDAFHSFHELTTELLSGKNALLVDAEKQSEIARDNDPHRTRGRIAGDAVERAFDAGLFSISEIAFDKGHHYALVAYSFVCGSLCGSGATVVVEKTAGEWKITDRRCGGWVS